MGRCSRDSFHTENKYHCQVVVLQKAVLGQHQTQLIPIQLLVLLTQAVIMLTPMQIELLDAVFTTMEHSIPAELVVI